MFENMFDKMFVFGSVEDDGIAIGFYVGIKNLAMSKDLIFSFSREPNQFAWLRFQIVDAGLFKQFQQMIIFEINVLGHIFSSRLVPTNDL